MTRNADQAARQAADRAADGLTRKLRSIADQAKTNRSTGFRIPTLDNDPDADDPTNFWFLEDGRVRGRTVDGEIHEFVDVAADRPPIPTFASDPAASSGWRLWFHGGSGQLRGRLANGTVVTYAPMSAGSSSDGGTGSAGGSTSTKPKPADPSPKRYRKVYGATWAKIYCSRHGVEGGSNLNYGYYDATHGERRIMFGLNDSLIRSDLTGATIRRVELHLRNTDSWSHSGVDISFGAHNKSAQPGSFSAVRRNVWTGHWPESGTGADWRGTRDWFGRALKAGDIRGLTVDQPANSIARYGELDWSSLRIAITFTK